MSSNKLLSASHPRTLSKESSMVRFSSELLLLKILLETELSNPLSLPRREELPSDSSVETTSTLLKPTPSTVVSWARNTSSKALTTKTHCNTAWTQNNSEKELAASLKTKARLSCAQRTNRHSTSWWTLFVLLLALIQLTSKSSPMASRLWKERLQLLERASMMSKPLNKPMLPSLWEVASQSLATRPQWFCSTVTLTLAWKQSSVAETSMPISSASCSFKLL